MKKFLAVMLAVVLTIGVNACGNNNGTGKDLVKVGDSVINSEQLDQYVELYAYIQGMDLTQINDKENLKYMKSLMLEDMISMEAIKQYYKGKEDKILPKTIDEDLKKFLEESKKTEDVKDFIEEKKISDETLTNFFYNQYYMNAYFKEIEGGMPNIEEDAKAYFENNKENYKVDEVTASHIVVKEEKLAKEILQKLKDGEKFEDLAAKYGTDDTKDVGGRLGTFGRGEMVKEFEDAAFALKPGELSDVVKTKFGYHIIKVTDKKEGYKTFDEVKSTIKAMLVSSEADTGIKKLRKDIGVEYLTKEYTGEDK